MYKKDKLHVCGIECSIGFHLKLIRTYLEGWVLRWMSGRSGGGIRFRSGRLNLQGGHELGALVLGAGQLMHVLPLLIDWEVLQVLHQCIVGPGLDLHPGFKCGLDISPCLVELLLSELVTLDDGSEQLGLFGVELDALVAGEVRVPLVAQLPAFGHVLFLAQREVGI